MESKPGIVLFAHGSRDARWREPIEAVARRVGATATDGSLVSCAYLELVEPDLAGAVDRLLGDGATAIRIVPLFLGIGKHLREDLPALVHDVRGRHPGLDVVLQPAVGEDDRMIDLLARLALDGSGAACR